MLHLAWAIVVALGIAQPLVDFLIHLHMMKEDVTVLPFDFGSAVLLVLLSAAAGYVVGYLFGTIWGKVQKM